MSDTVNGREDGRLLSCLRGLGGRGTALHGPPSRGRERRRAARKTICESSSRSRRLLLAEGVDQEGDHSIALQSRSLIYVDPHGPSSRRRPSSFRRRSLRR